jgi:hypothetical protein
VQCLGASSLLPRLLPAPLSYISLYLRLQALSFHFISHLLSPAPDRSLRTQIHSPAFPSCRTQLIGHATIVERCSLLLYMPNVPSATTTNVVIAPSLPYDRGQETSNQAHTRLTEFLHHIITKAAARAPMPILRITRLPKPLPWGYKSLTVAQGR